MENRLGWTEAEAQNLGFNGLQELLDSEAEAAAEYERSQGPEFPCGEFPINQG